ncbi:MAG: hypothetical protein ACI9JN_001119 [Bacteroidia bacterium]|jgi:hypothetical protein
MEHSDKIRLIEHYIKEKKNGMEYSHMRGELSNLKISKDDIKFIFKNVDNAVLNDLVTKSTKEKAFEKMIIGATIFVLGLALTIVSYLGIIGMGKFVLIAWGPVAGGLGMAILNYNVYRKK